MSPKSYKLFSLLLIAFLIAIPAMQEVSALKFGSSEMRAEFMFAKDYICLNHGSYGSTPRRVWEAVNRCELEVETNPDLWFRQKAEPRMLETLRSLAKYVQCDASDIVFIENASDGANAVLKSFDWTAGDKILMFNIAYGMVKQTVNFLKDRYKIDTVFIDLQVEDLQSSQKIIQKVKDTIKGETKIKLASIDHITSMPSVIIPIKEIVQILHDQKIPVFVDGAHVVGNIPLNLTDINADFYLSNFHKWFYGPKSAAFLYVSKEFQKIVHPNIISHNYPQGIQKEFYMTGTRNYCAYVAVKEALDMRMEIGDTAIMNYNREVVWEGAKLFAEIINSTVMVKDPKMSSCMVMVEIPIPMDTNKLNFANQQFFLFSQTFVLMDKYIANGKYYARLSGQIWNGIHDYEYGARVLKDILAKITAEFPSPCTNDTCGETQQATA